MLDQQRERARALTATGLSSVDEESSSPCAWFDVGDKGSIKAAVADSSGVIDSSLRIPHHQWPGYETSNDKAPCRVDGYVAAFPWPEGPSPAYLVRTLEDGWLYEFRPDGLLPHLPHAKVKAALRERLRFIDQGPFGPAVPGLPPPKLTKYKNTRSADHVEIRRLWKRVWLSERAGTPWFGDDDELGLPHGQRCVPRGAHRGLSISCRLGGNGASFLKQWGAWQRHVRRRVCTVHGAGDGRPGHAALRAVRG